MLGVGFFGVPKVVKFVKKIDIDCSFASHQATDSYLAAILMPKLDCDFSYDKDGESGSGNSGSKLIEVDHNKVIDQLINKAIPGRVTKGRSTQYELSGGFEQVLKDFEKLRPEIIKNTSELKIGTLNDGRTVIVRKKVA